jgi:hypothetical protein
VKSVLTTLFDAALLLAFLYAMFCLMYGTVAVCRMPARSEPGWPRLPARCRRRLDRWNLLVFLTRTPGRAIPI